MADMQSVVTRVKRAITSAGEAPDHALPTIPRSADTYLFAEMASRFASELEKVVGRMIGPIGPDELAYTIVATARERGANSVAIGKGVALNLTLAAQALEDAGMAVVKAGPVDSDTRAAMRDKLAHADAGVAEADYAIASTGTLAVLSDEHRPSALTLLPPASIVVLRIDRIKADLAGALEAIGPAELEARRLTLITGPSRTADIEKRIVMGVHGPKSLDVIVVWPRND